MDPRRGLCGCCLRAAKWVPVVFIASIVVWSYYAYVVQLCLLTVDSNVERTVLLVLYHLFFAMFVWAYWQTIFTPPGSVPENFWLTAEEMERIEGSENLRATLEQLVLRKDLPCVTRSLQQEVRFCSECSVVKPDRAHHCSVCGSCILKMDHHCPWVNNCVAFRNYKFFILFLGYALLYCLFVCLSTLQYFLQFWTSLSAGSENGSRFHVLFLFFVGAMFSLSLASLFFYHLYLVSKNMTTLESFRAPITRNGPDKMAFYLGKSSNFQEVFGDSKVLWFLPMFSSFGDGVAYPQRGQLDEEAGLLGGQSPTNVAAAVGPPGENVAMMLSPEEREDGRKGARDVGSEGGSREATAAGLPAPFTPAGTRNGDLVTVNM